MFWKNVFFNMYIILRAGTSLIGFSSESLVFCQKLSEWAIGSKKWANHSFAPFWWATSAIRSQSLIFSERPEWIAHGPSFLVSNLSDSLTSLIWFEQNERFTHIAHQKRENEREWAKISDSLIFSKKFVLKIVYKTY